MQDSAPKVHARVPGVTIYKPARRSGEHHPYLIAYVDPATGRRRVETAAADLDIARLKAMEVSRRIQMVRCGILDGRTDRLNQQAKRPMGEHLSDYQAYLGASGDTENHVTLTVQRVRRVLEVGQVQTLGQLTPGVVKVTIDTLPHTRLKHTPAAISEASKNHYLRAVKMFSAWLRRDRRTPEDDIRSVKPWNSEVHPRHARRALTEAELRHLLAVVEKSLRNFSGLSGTERALIYRFAVATGLRANEIRTLTKISFNLQSVPPTATVMACNSKHRRTDLVVLSPEIAEVVRPLVESTADGKQLFPLPRSTSRMLMQDLREAGIPYELCGTYLDFHALRHTAITRVVNVTTNMKIAQTFARHCTINLTMRYAHATQGDVAAMLAKLPSLGTSLSTALSQITGVQRLAQRGGSIAGELAAALMAERQTLRT